MKNEKSVCPICGETQEDWDDSIDWTCPNLCQVEIIDNEVQKDYEEYWKDIIEKDGVVDMEQVKKELSDFRYIIEQLPKVYMHITNGILSKHMYSAETIIRLHDDIRTEEIENACKETAQDFVMQCFEADNGNHVISTCELEQLKERYGLNDTNTD